MKLVLAWIGAASAILPASPAAFAQPVAETASGRVSGVTAEGVAAFKGIPYAKPPVGDLRWRAPQKPLRWKGVRDASRFGSICMQPAAPALAAQPPMSEDCLTVNVWRPEAGGGKRPVLVWIHGGGWVSGSSAEPEYDGSALARRGIVVVSFNYRLGRFGFFAHPELSAAKPDGRLLGNYAYMDQLAALRWVRDNVAGFGGDPQKVTIFGSSAGGSSVDAMMMAPQARGLFRAAITSSPADPDMPGLASPSAGGSPSAEAAGLAFAKLESAADLSALRALSAEKILENASFPNTRPDLFTGPMIDGYLVRETSGAAFAAGRVARVPFMSGAQDGEVLGALLSPAADAIAAMLASRLPEGTEARLQRLYDPAGRERRARIQLDMVGDRLFVAHARETVAAMQRLGMPAWEYRFAYVPEAKRSLWAGAGHGSNGGYAFDRLDALLAVIGPFSPADRQVARAYADAIVNFTKRLDPNGPSLPRWPHQQPGDRILWIGNDGLDVMIDPWHERLDAMGSVTTPAARP